MKLVVNRGIGSRFSLSASALSKLGELKGRGRLRRDLNRPVTTVAFGLAPEVAESDWVLKLERNDADLVGLVEELGPAASGLNAELTIVEIPDGCVWKISDAVGYEFVVVNGDVF